MNLSEIIKRAGTFLMACVIIILLSSSAYLQASEGEIQTERLSEEQPGSSYDEESVTVELPSGTGAESPTEAGSRMETKPSTEAGSVTETKPSTEAGSVTKTESPTEAGSGTETEPPAEVESGTGTEHPAGAESGTGTELPTEAGSGMETEHPADAESGIETELPTDAESVTGTELPTEAEAGTETESLSGAGAGAETESWTEEEPETETESPAGEETESESMTEEESETETEPFSEEIPETDETRQRDIFGLAPGESMTFYTSVGTEDNADNGIMTAAITAVKVTRADEPYWYADYNLGTRWTYKYTVTFNGITSVAYCIRPSLGSPESSDGYSVTKIKGAKMLAKVCYYGTKAAGDEGFFAEKYPEMSSPERFIITHIAAAYANGSPDTFEGTNERAKSLAMELYEYCAGQPEIPDVDMEFSSPEVTAYIDGKQQRTKEITFQADELQSVTFKLPEGVKFHNVTTGKTSKAGESVEINGGTKFYLSAPLTQGVDVAPSWSSRMKGSITKDYSAYKISTGPTTQDLALVFGEGVDDEKYVSFSVKWVEQAEVELQKTDSRTGKGLAGAVFGVYSDAKCTKLIVKMPETDADGKARVKLDKTQDTVYLKEISAPEGYSLGTEIYPAALKEGKKVTVTAKNNEILGGLRIYKEGEVLTGASVTEEGTSFQYEKRGLAGAVYNVHANADIIGKSGDVVYHAGDLVAGNLVTGPDGFVTLENLHAGSYAVTEARAPANYYNGQSVKVVQVSAGADIPEAAFQADFLNERQKAEVSVVKQDEERGKPLTGAVFGLFADADISNVDGAVVAAKDTLLGKAVTGADGTAKFTVDLPIGAYYYVKELQAPEKYLLNEEDIFRFTFAYAGEETAQVSFTHTFTDRRAAARIRLIKKDAQTGTAQGDATLEHAIYGLYAKEDIIRPDGTGEVLFRKDEQVCTLTTAADGTAAAENLYLGNYYIKELSPSNGYLLDENVYDISCMYEGVQTAVTEAECVSSETVIRQPFQIIKIAENGKADADVLQGAGFSAYLLSSLQKNADGTYNFNSAEPVVLGENGATEIFTDENGYAVSVPLPFGTYLVRETTVPRGYAPTADFEVRITENNPTKPQAWRILRDEEFSARLKIIKSDDETQKPVLEEDTEFRVYDMDSGEYIEQVTTYPTEVKHTSYFTDESGYLILPQSLPMGRYRIEEVTAPDGYTIGKGITEIDVNGDAAYRMDDASGGAIIETVASNHPVKGQLKIVKKGEVLCGHEDDFLYEEKPLAGAVYEVYAAENIYTPDFQKDSAGNRILEYAQGTLVAELTTGKTGEAVLNDLPLGLYCVAEKKAPEGFVLSEEKQNVRFAYVDQNTPVVTMGLEFIDRRQRVEISVFKKDALDQTLLAGARFGLYAKEDISCGGKSTVKADTLLAEAVTDGDGKAVFRQDLPFGEYYVKELQAPEGYLLSEKTVELKAVYGGQEAETVYLNAVFENDSTIVEFTKTDITTGAELDGAVLSVLDKGGNVIDSWTSVRGQPHAIRRLHAGETYILREETAPYGYLLAEETEFRVEDTGVVQKVEMKDAVPTGRITISKTGEFIESVTWSELAAGMAESLFSYLWGALEQVTFEIYAAEDIKAADGISGIYYRKDELVKEITTDTLGFAMADGLPLGKYYVVEKKTADGFVLDKEPREVDLTYRDQNTPVVTYDEGWQNTRQKAAVTVLKKEKGTDRVLEGAVFALCAKNNIISAGGEVLIRADAVIEQKTTGENGMLSFSADLPVGGTYYIKEVKAPDGFVTTDEIREFTFASADDAAAVTTFDFVFEDEATCISITKKDITGGDEIPGAKLSLTDSKGNITEEWVSATEPHIIRELTAGEEYTLREESAPKGYIIAEEITFRVGNTGNIQSVEMKDDCAMGQVVLCKSDADTGKPMKGAEFALRDSDGRTLETLVTDEKGTASSGLYPIATFRDGEYGEPLTYTVKEVKAPEGYQLDEEEYEVAFEWEDDQTPVIEYRLEVDNEKIIPETDAYAPRTGDQTNILLPTIAAAVSGCAFILLAAVRRKKANKRLS